MGDSLLRLDVGCGGRGTAWDGFIGIDTWPTPAKPRKPDEEYMQLDFVRGTLPWAPGTADEIIGLHVIEHMLRPDGLILMKRVYELLKPGAGVTISCPDLHKLCVKYLREDEQFWARRYGRTGKEIWPGDTLADRLNEAMHQQGHLWSYDLNSLTCLAVHAGWKNVRPMPLTSRYSVRKDHETGIVCVKE